MSSYDYTAEQFPRKFGNYHLLAPLAQGGMGALYLAVKGDRGLERLLVIKTVLPHLADAEYISRFRDEAKVVVKLSHGNLIPVFDAGQVDGELFLAMDFVEGRDLRAVWNRCAKKQVAFPIDVAVYLTKELCRGLAYAHSFGNLKLVHRDISPPNILISFSGEVKLTDFGLASSTLKLEKTAPGIIYGKVAYMSPEQARGEPLDGRSDLYAAAIVLWELLTGRQLFPPGKDQPHDLLQRARNPVPMAPSKRAPRVPTALDEVCLRALAPTREDRYATGDEMREALSAWLTAEAPGTDANRIEAFLYDLFAEDIVRERREREELLQSIRKRVHTLPPTDELRRMIEGARAAGAEAGVAADAETEIDIEDLGSDPAVEQKLMRAPGSVGRRAADQGAKSRDRRQTGERRGPGGSAGQEPANVVRDLDEMVEAPSGAAAVGQVIDGRYSIQELIGEGGMGKVYLAEHVEIGRRVAIKILHPVYSRMPDLVERFRREARAASKIGHPHIVDVTDSGTTEDGSVYFVMEYLEGVELASVIAREGALEMTRCLRISIQMCRALAAAHTVGIIHRDLKPENIFLTTRDGAPDFVKVLDFGIAKSMESEQARARRLTSPGMAMGTPEYMAPEQAAGKQADQRSDIYAVGAILYESLTGVPPYEGDNFMEILTKKATVDPTPPQRIRREVPDEVNALTLRAMARNPEQRPPSMESFEYELNKCLAGRGAAVAKVLGMGADPAMPGPGMPMHADDGLADRRIGAATGSNAALRLGTPNLDVGDSTEALRPVGLGSRRGVLMGIGLVSALVIGAGVVLIAASGGEPDKPAAPVAINAAPVDAAPAAVRPGPVVDAAPVVPPRAAIDAAPPDAAPQKPAASDDDPVPESEAEASALLKKAKQAERSGKYSQARRMYKTLSRSKYRRADTLMGLARVSFQTGKYSESSQFGLDALRKGANRVEANTLIGRAFYKQNKRSDAKRYYQAVLRDDPDNAEATAVLGKL